MSYLAVVGPQDAAIFEYARPKPHDVHTMRQFTLYAALDALDSAAWQKGDLYLPDVDRPFGENLCVSACVGLAPVRIVVMQEGTPRDNLKLFFSEAYGVVARHLMNPFADPTRTIDSPQFTKAMIALYDRYL